VKIIRTFNDININNNKILIITTNNNNNHSKNNNKCKKTWRECKTKYKKKHNC